MKYKQYSWNLKKSNKKSEKLCRSRGWIIIDCLRVPFLKSDRRGNLRHSTSFIFKLWAMLVQYDDNWFSGYNQKIPNAIILLHYWAHNFLVWWRLRILDQQKQYVLHIDDCGGVLRPHMACRNYSVYPLININVQSRFVISHIKKKKWLLLFIIVVWW